MKRTLAIFLVGFSLVAAAAPRVRPDFGVVFNDDADLAFVVPDRARAEEFLRANVGALADTPVKTFVYCIGMGGDLLYYNTKVASRVGWRKSPDEKPGSLMEKRMENARVCLAQGADAVRTAGETAKQLGLRFIPSLRMNDAHFMTNPDSHAMTSEFWFKHRHEYTIKDSPLAFQAAYGNLLDYSRAAVRQLRLDTVFEALARNHDLVDGFELDFNRFQVFFPKGKAASGAPLITELVRRVRARLDELAVSEKRPMYLFVRVPPSVTDCTTAGLDVERWMREGLVDLVSPAQIMTLAGDMPIADLVALGRQHGVRVHPSLYPRTGWRLPFAAAGENRYAGAAVGRDGTPEEIRGAAANYRAMGVDGFYLFNFYNGFGAARPHDDRLYHVFRDLARTENLRGQSAVYAVTKSNYFDGPGSYAYGKQLPAKLAPGVTSRIVLAIAENLSAGPFPLLACELRVGLRAVPEGATVAIALNGKPVFGGPMASGARVITKQLVKTLPRQPDQAEEYLHVPLAAGLMPVHGANDFTITVAGATKPVEVTDLEVRYDYQNDLEKIWHRVPVR
jgi:hypothetical protein